MMIFIFRRILAAIPVLLVVVTLTFFLMRVAPGNPFSTDRAIPETILRQLEARYKLDGSIGEQYCSYLGDLFHGDLRLSTRYRNRTVNEIIAQTLPISLTIGGMAFCLAMGLGITLGTIAAMRHNAPTDRAAMFVALLGISTPVFVLAPLSILIFGIYLGWLPVAGWGGLRELILPSCCLAAPFAASIARLMRTSLLEVLRQDFVRTARAKGLSESGIVARHALKVAILPVLSYAGPLAANLLTGSLVIEQIFAIPGIGLFFVNSVLSRDVFMVGGVVLVYSVFLLGFNLIVDVAYAVLDRRIRIE